MFEPHVTLLSGIKGDEDSIAEKIKLLSEEISPFTITINKISHSDYYYRCVILELALTPELEQAFETAKKIFDKTDTLTYLPHISIVYGDLIKSTRINICNELNSMMNKKTKVDSLSLLHASTSMPPAMDNNYVPVVKRVESDHAKEAFRVEYKKLYDVETRRKVGKMYKVFTNKWGERVFDEVKQPQKARRRMRGKFRIIRDEDGNILSTKKID